MSQLAISLPLPGPHSVEQRQKHNRSCVERVGCGCLGPAFRQEAHHTSTKRARPSSCGFDGLEQNGNASPDGQRPLPHSLHMPSVVPWGLGRGNEPDQPPQLLSCEGLRLPASGGLRRHHPAPTRSRGILPNRPPSSLACQQQGPLAREKAVLANQDACALHAAGPLADPPKKSSHAALAFGQAPLPPAIPAGLPGSGPELVLIKTGLHDQLLQQGLARIRRHQGRPVRLRFGRNGPLELPKLLLAFRPAPHL